VQAWKKHFLDGLASPSLIRERVIVIDTRRNLDAIVVVNLAFVGATKSNINYLMAEYKKLAKNL